MNDRLNKARKIGCIMLGAGLLCLLLMVGEVASTGKTSMALIWLATTPLVVGLGAIYDPRSLIAISSSRLFPVEIRSTMPPEAKRTGYLFVALGTALTFLVDYAFFE